MSRKGLLVDYQWCTGCHSCEIACQMEHNLPPEQFGIKVFASGPCEYGGGDDEKWLPAPTTNSCGNHAAP